MNYFQFIQSNILKYKGFDTSEIKNKSYQHRIQKT
jgi:hypothetical protein